MVSAASMAADGGPLRATLARSTIAFLMAGLLLLMCNNVHLNMYPACVPMAFGGSLEPSAADTRICRIIPRSSSEGGGLLMPAMLASETDRATDCCRSKSSTACRISPSSLLEAVASAAPLVLVQLASYRRTSNLLKKLQVHVNAACVVSAAVVAESRSAAPVAAVSTAAAPVRYVDV